MVGAAGRRNTGERGRAPISPLRHCDGDERHSQDLRSFFAVRHGAARQRPADELVKRINEKMSAYSGKIAWGKEGVSIYKKYAEEGWEGARDELARKATTALAEALVPSRRRQHHHRRRVGQGRSRVWQPGDRDRQPEQDRSHHQGHLRRLGRLCQIPDGAPQRRQSAVARRFQGALGLGAGNNRILGRLHRQEQRPGDARAQSRGVSPARGDLREHETQDGRAARTAARGEANRGRDKGNAVPDQDRDQQSAPAPARSPGTTARHCVQPAARLG